MLAVEVEKRLGDFSLAVAFKTEGGVTAVLGPSGAGKTTLVNMISGLVAPDRGRKMTCWAVIPCRTSRSPRMYRSSASVTVRSARVCRSIRPRES